MSTSFSPPRVLAFTAGGALVRDRLVKFGSGDEIVVQSSATSDESIGVTCDDISSAVATAGARTEVNLPGGGSKLEAGGTVTRGDLLMSDASGRGIVATTGLEVVAMAMESGVIGDKIAVELMRSRLP